MDFDRYSKLGFDASAIPSLRVPLDLLLLWNEAAWLFSVREFSRFSEF